MATTTTYNIKFLAIELIAKSVFEPLTTAAEGQKQEFTFNFLIDLRLNPDLKVAAIITDVSIIGVKENREVAHFKTLCAFELIDFDSIFTKVDETKYDAPVDLEIILKANALSTTRGIVFSELRGTYLQGTVMPLVNLQALIKEQRGVTEEIS